MQIEVRNLGHVYSPGMPFETVALSDVSFTVNSGEFAAIIGHTGSGKSTLLMHLKGLLKPTSGGVFADGTDITEKSQTGRELRRKIGLVFQYPEYQLFEETVLKDVCFGPKNFGFSQEECENMAKDALQLVGMDPQTVSEKSPFELSGGEKRRVAIAGVLAMEPEVLILDEPTAGLDPSGHNEILDMIRRIKNDRGMTIILVTHSMDDAAELADRIIVMDKGRLSKNGSPREVFSDAEGLKAIGLDIPSCTNLLCRLKEGGLDVRTDIFTAKDAAAEIAAAYKRRWQ